MEDFSFPIISNPLSNLIPLSSLSSSSSSSLWRVSSRVFHHEEEEEDGRVMEVRSLCEEGLFTSSSPMVMSNVECMSCQGDDQEWEVEVEMEERMDYLWEDFNYEEEKRESSKRIIMNDHKEISKIMGRRPKTSIRSRSSSSSSSRRPRNTSILLMGKFLKGLLSIKKSAQHKIMKPRFS